MLHVPSRLIAGVLVIDRTRLQLYLRLTARASGIQDRAGKQFSLNCSKDQTRAAERGSTATSVKNDQKELSGVACPQTTLSSVFHVLLQILRTGL